MNRVVHTQVLNALLVEFSHDCGCVWYLMCFIVVFFGCLFAKKDIREDVVCSEEIMTPVVIWERKKVDYFFYPPV